MCELPRSKKFGQDTFNGAKLNFLQIGLGTFGTFIDNLTDARAVSPEVSLLLHATRVRSQWLKGVGVEPVPRYVERLTSNLAALPCTGTVICLYMEPYVSNGTIVRV